jgi:hypothetical protein
MPRRLGQDPPDARTWRHADLPDADDEALAHSVVSVWWELRSSSAGEAEWAALGPDPHAVVLERARYRRIVLPLTALAGQYPRNAVFYLEADGDPDRYALVRRLAGMVRRGGTLPPVVVSRLSGNLRLLDGQHRLTALELGDRSTCEAFELVSFASQ